MSVSMGRAPLRIPLAGGLTDLPAFLDGGAGATVSIAIDSYVHAVAKPNPNGRSTLHLNHEVLTAPSLGRLGNGLVDSVVTALARDAEGVDLYLFSDLPASSGLGGSGAATVALVAALSDHLGIAMDREAVLRAAARAEVVHARNGGFHDTAISTLGGLRHITYGSDGVIGSEEVGADIGRALCADSWFGWTGWAEATAASIADISVRIDRHRSALVEMAAIASELARDLAATDGVTPRMLELIEENQRLKAQVLGDEYRTLLSRCRAATGGWRDGRIVLLPGGKLGSTVWVLGQPDAVGEVRERGLLAELRPATVRVRPADGVRLVLRADG